MKFFHTLFCLVIILGFSNCNKGSSDPAPTPPVPPAPAFTLASMKLNDASPVGVPLYNVNNAPAIKLNFSAPVDRSTVAANILLTQASGANVNYTVTYTDNDNTINILSSAPLTPLTKYIFTIRPDLVSQQKVKLKTASSFEFITAMDSSDKFPRISDNALLDLVQRQHFKYFWEFGHPVSGLARERNTSGDLVTSGGSGFGIMAIVTAVERKFITRTEGLQRLQKMVSFLKNTAQKFKGAFPHWLNGATGEVIPFSTKDNGADLVETSYLMQGLLCARQYFNGGDAAETLLRQDVNSLWNGVDWNWFRKNNENVLYWHWSPNYNWEMNLQIKGWNESLITYVLAASSPTSSIPKIVYDNGWASNGGMKNGAVYYGYQLPLGPPFGGPLFFSHYSFLGINPKSLTDVYANYQTQVVNHTLINYEYCKANPKAFFGYSDQSWGLTASDIPNGYTASSPTNDIGVIAPTAAISSMPYTPVESMKALRFFYYTLGDKLWKEYGFVDAFSLKELWFANSFLAIDQGPIIIMIENHRSGLLWNLFMSCPEVKSGMTALGFQSPHF